MYYLYTIPSVRNLIKSSVAAKSALRCLVAAAVPILLDISKALTGLRRYFFSNLNVASPTLLMNSVDHSTFFVASDSVSGLFF